MNHATVSISVCYLSPDYSGFVKFSSRSYCVVLCFVHKSTSLAKIEFSVILSMCVRACVRVGAHLLGCV